MYATLAIVIKYFSVIVGIHQCELSNQRNLCLWTEELFLFSEILVFQIWKTSFWVGKNTNTPIFLAGYALRANIPQSKYLNNV